MTNQDQAAQVIRTWQKRHKSMMDDNPDWAAQNLAIDLHNAGLIAAALPVPDRYMSPPRGAVWYLLGPIGDIRCTGDTIVAYGMDFRRQSFRLVMSKEETETLALTLLAAANHAEEA